MEITINGEVMTCLCEFCGTDIRTVKKRILINYKNIANYETICCLSCFNFRSKLDLSKCTECGTTKNVDYHVMQTGPDGPLSSICCDSCWNDTLYEFMD